MLLFFFISIETEFKNLFIYKFISINLTKILNSKSLQLLILGFISVKGLSSHAFIKKELEFTNIYLIF